MANPTPKQQTAALKTLSWSILILSFFLLLMGYVTLSSAGDVMHASNTPTSHMVAFVIAAFLAGCSFFPHTTFAW